MSGALCWASSMRGLKSEISSWSMIRYSSMRLQGGASAVILSFFVRVSALRLTVSTGVVHEECLCDKFASSNMNAQP